MYDAALPSFAAIALRKRFPGESPAVRDTVVSTVMGVESHRV